MERKSGALAETTPLLSPESDEQSVDRSFSFLCLRTEENHNVVLALIICALVGTSESVWASAILVSYLYVLTGNNNATAGYVEATAGMATLFTALPVGWLADKYSRSVVIRVGGVCGLLASGITAFSIIYGADKGYDDPVALTLLLLSMAVWGVIDGIVSGPVQALYADSVEEGKRSQYYVYLFGCYILGSAIGPLVSIVLFHFTHNEWHVPVLRDVILVGIGIELAGVFLMIFFDDRKSLPEELREASGAEEKEDETRAHWTVPYLLLFISILVGLGSGMFVKFVPLFFKNECGLNPSEVQGVYVVLPVLMVLCSSLSQQLSGVIGRVQTILIMKTIGVALLFAMVFLEGYKHDWRVMVPIYVVRAAVFNSTFPIEESILMDAVPKKSRARWKSVESVAQFGWCGSAAVGGILADSKGYTFTFLITAIVQGVSLIPIAVLWFLVPRFERKGEDKSS